MKRMILSIGVLGMAGAICTCGTERPWLPEGRNSLSIVALDTSGINGSGWIGVPGAKVEVSSMTHEYKATFETDENGMLVIDHLVSGAYTVQASKKDESTMVLLIGQVQEKLKTASETSDTIFMSFVPTSPVVINEVYFAGCNASSFYYYDQFVELYNTTNDTLYLDGYFLVRGTQADGIFDWSPETSDYALGYYVFTFPGTRGVTHECPIAPKGFLVAATDAVNHHNYGALCVDLSHADWEFFNALGNDYDAPARNLTPISRYTQDMALNLGHSTIWLATGEDYRFNDHCYMSGTSMICSEYCEIPLSTVLDGVEFSGTRPTDPTHRYLSIRVDAGFAGVGIARYTGKSTERKVPGLDSNNSDFDFENATPTPGYSHSRE